MLCRWIGLCECANLAFRQAVGLRLEMLEMLEIPMRAAGHNLQLHWIALFALDMVKMRLYFTVNLAICIIELISHRFCPYSNNPR